MTFYDITFVELVGSTTSFEVVSVPTTGEPSVAPNNRLAFHLTNITGVNGVDFTATFSFYVPKFAADGSHILDPLTGNSRVSYVYSGYSYTVYNNTYETNAVSLIHHYLLKDSKFLPL